jgi:3'-phosphoadenosine 5'-phosphosulfate sulfotransferase (PAPS reductase)/FAD synthetase
VIPAAASPTQPRENQLGLFDDGAGPVTLLPDLTTYDVLLVNSSGGKDSQALLGCVNGRALAQGLTDRITVVHADLGDVEWPGTRQLAEAQAARYRVRFEVVAAREGLLERAERRGMWPDAARRWCTSDLKRGPVRTVMTRLARELDTTQRPRILNLMGLRAEESPVRARRPPLAIDEAASSGRREVTECLPLLHWRLGHVWDRIAGSITADLVHPAYAAGMPRLSCSFCVLAPKAALVRAAQLRPEKAASTPSSSAGSGTRSRRACRWQRSSLLRRQARHPTWRVGSAEPLPRLDNHVQDRLRAAGHHN